MQSKKLHLFVIIFAQVHFVYLSEVEFSKNIEKWLSYRIHTISPKNSEKFKIFVTQPFFNIFWKFHFWEVGQVNLSKNNHKKMSFFTLHKRVCALNFQQNLKFNLNNLLLWPKKGRLGKPLKRCIFSYIFTFWQKIGKKICSSPWFSHIHENHTYLGNFFVKKVQIFSRHGLSFGPERFPIDFHQNRIIFSTSAAFIVFLKFCPLN